MGKTSRTKGASGERELAGVLFAELGMEFRRDLRQYQQTALGDLVCDDPAFPFLIECKRYAKGWTCSPAWEVQAFEAAKAASKHPCVAYRFDGKKWRFRIWIDALGAAFGASPVAGAWVETDAHGFAWICREMMARNSDISLKNIPLRGEIS
jgi:Holliday junction resolvase